MTTVLLYQLPLNVKQIIWNVYRHTSTNTVHASETKDENDINDEQRNKYSYTHTYTHNQTENLYISVCYIIITITVPYVFSVVFFCIAQFNEKSCAIHRISFIWIKKKEIIEESKKERNIKKKTREKQNIKCIYRYIFVSEYVSMSVLHICIAYDMHYCMIAVIWDRHS